MNEEENEVEQVGFKARPPLSDYEVEFTKQSNGHWEWILTRPTRPGDEALSKLIYDKDRSILGSGYCLHRADAVRDAWDALCQDQASPASFTLDGIELEHEMRKSGAGVEDHPIWGFSAGELGL